MLERRTRKRVELRFPVSTHIASVLMCIGSVGLAGSAEADESKEQPQGLSGGKNTSQKRNRATTLRKLEEALEQEDVFTAQELLRVFSDRDIQKNPRLLVAKALVAKILYRKDEAYEILRSALKLNENFAPAQFETALILMERREWKDAEVLLRLSASADDLGRQRRQMVPYYLGVIAFETGRLFTARNSFSRLGWIDGLDPALEQSVGAFLSKIAVQRPWALIAPLTYQYDANVLGLQRGAELPAGFNRRAGYQVIAGLFGSVGGLGGSEAGSGPFGLALRLFTVQNLHQSFHPLNVLFSEAELNWSTLVVQSFGVFRTALTGNLIRAGQKSVSSAAGLKFSFLQTELNLAYEFDLQKNAEIDRSAWSARVFRDQEVFKLRGLAASIPVDAGSKIGVRSNPDEKRYDLALSPTLTFSPNKRANIKLSEKFSYERISWREQSSESLFRSVPSLGISFSAQPFLILSVGGSFEWQKNMTTQAIVQKGVVTTSLLGIL